MLVRAGESPAPTVWRALATDATAATLLALIDGEAFACRWSLDRTTGTLRRGGTALFRIKRT